MGYLPWESSSDFPQFFLKDNKTDRRFNDLLNHPFLKKNVNEYVSMFISYIICGVASNGTVSDEVIIAAFLNGLEIIKRKLECEKNNITLTEKEMMKFKLSEKTLEEKIRELNLLGQKRNFVLDCTNIIYFY